MIEKASAVEQLDEILAVPGIDMIQWGPADYSMSIGRPGEWNHPDVRRVERDVFERCIKAGVPPRAELNNPKDAARFLEMGVKDFCMGTDLYVIYDWMRDNGKALRDDGRGGARSGAEHRVHERARARDAGHGRHRGGAPAARLSAGGRSAATGRSVAHSAIRGGVDSGRGRCHGQWHLDLEREAEGGSDEHDRAENDHALERG